MIDGYFCYTPAYNPVFTPIVQAYQVTGGAVAVTGQHVRPLAAASTAAERTDRRLAEWRPPVVGNANERYPQCVVVGSLLDRYDADVST